MNSNELRVRFREGNGNWKEGKVISQSSVGKVRVQWTGGETQLVDLASSEYQWLE